MMTHFQTLTADATLPAAPHVHPLADLQNLQASPRMTLHLQHPSSLEHVPTASFWPRC